MKRILTVAALILTTGILASCNKTTHVQAAPTGIFSILSNDKKDLASGD